MGGVSAGDKRQSPFFAVWVVGRIVRVFGVLGFVDERGF